MGWTPWGSRSTTPDARTATRRLVSALAVERSWPVALVVALLVIGPALAPGMVLNLDLVLVPQLDLPSGTWGLGPELPRRLPLWVPVSLLDALVPATVLGKCLLVGQLVLGWTGMVRLFRWMRPFEAHVVGALYVLGPFLATRAVVGHFMVTVPMAILPWVLPTLARPGRSLGATLLAASALGFGGHFGGSIAVLVVAVAVLSGDRHRWPAALGVTVLAQSAWLVPGVAVWLATDRAASSSMVFATIVDGPADLFRVFAGGGFWNGYFQTGATGTSGALLGGLLVALALAGTSSLPPASRRVTELLAAIGIVVTLASGLPGVDRWFDAATTNPVLAVWRESQRMLSLTWFWLVPSVVCGARRLAELARGHGRPSLAGAAASLPAASLLVLAIPSLWAYGGRIEAMPVPDGWDRARELVREHPGTVVALPWRQYFNLQVGDSQVHRVLHPLPLFLGGDVVTSSDNQLGLEVRERGDPREAWLDGAMDRLEEGAPVGSELGPAGVRWVVLLDTVQAERYAALYDDVALHLVLDTPEIDVFAVETWSGAASAADGRRVDVDTYGPVTVVDADAVRWSAPAGPGWRRGWAGTGATEFGTVRLEPGSRLIWNMATVPALVGQLGQLAVVLELLRRRSRCLWTAHRRSTVPAGPTGPIESCTEPTSKGLP